MKRILSGGSFSLTLGETPVIMGILNVTPDSFSDGGQYFSSAEASRHFHQMVNEGAAVIDIGGESTRPNSRELSSEEEIARLHSVKDVISGAALPVSVDTYHSQTAATVLSWGAWMINDVWGFQKDPEMAAVAASAECPVCLMSNHSGYPVGSDIMADICRFLEKSLKTAVKAGVKEEKIIIDPGIGFGMEPSHSFEVLRRLGELHAFGLPILLGTSRKRMFLSLFHSSPQERDTATAVTTAAGVAAGVDFFRVHNVAVNRQAAITAAALFPGRSYPYDR